MPLVECPDCKNEVSDSAKICSKCGFPISEKLIECPECHVKSFGNPSSCSECGYPLSRPPATLSAGHPEQAPTRVMDRKVQKRTTVAAKINTSNGASPEVSKGIARSTEIAQGMGAAMAMHKSYVGTSFGVLVLYFIFYLPGLILNIVWLNEATRIKKQTGVSPSGRGCLIILWYLFFLIPAACALGLGILVLIGLVHL